MGLSNIFREEEDIIKDNVFVQKGEWFKITAESIA